MITMTVGSIRFVVLEKQDSFIDPRTTDEAVALLRPLKHDPLQLSTIHRFIAATSSQSWRPLQAEESLRQLAGQIVRGRLKVITTPWASRKDRGGPDKTAQAQEASRAFGGNSWIEILLRDRKGRPIPGEKYQVKLPDGSIEDGVLDAHGHAEYYGINPGTCEVSFPNIPDEKWDLA